METEQSWCFGWLPECDWWCFSGGFRLLGFWCFGFPVIFVGEDEEEEAGVGVNGGCRGGFTGGERGRGKAAGSGGFTGGERGRGKAVGSVVSPVLMEVWWCRAGVRENRGKSGSGFTGSYGGYSVLRLRGSGVRRRGCWSQGRKGFPANQWPDLVVDEEREVGGVFVAGKNGRGREKREGGGC
ncbi:hypothetical protein HAX54_033039 [Datura stramonium]|uniref:Uncharacterized protein n=1 Tax=Datura stramonium TaxID=4076 RepID=A0ABS8VEL5_DATST|nr:hypothetical protein [Datura stramonium]